MMIIVLRLLSLLGLKSRWHFQLLAPEQGCFSWDRMSVDSWTPGSKPLCHRHPTGPHPSGLLWTPRTNFALVHQTVEFAGVLAGDLVGDVGRQLAELLGDVFAGVRPDAVGVGIVG